MESAYLKLPEGVSQFIPTSQQEWLEWRKGGIGASVVSALFDENPFKTKRQLWSNLIGESEDIIHETPLMKRGKETEALITELIRKKYPNNNIKEQICLQKGPIRCTLDLWLEPPEGPIMELKYYNCPKRYRDLKEVPRAHWWQIQQQLLLSGAPRCYYNVTHDGMNYKEIKVLPDREAFKQIQEQIDRFWSENVLMQLPPDFKHHKEELDENTVLAKKCRRYKEIQAICKEGEYLLTEIRKLAEGPFSYRGINCSITPCKSVLDYKSFFEREDVQKALKDAGIKMDVARNPERMIKRVYFSKDYG